MPDKYVDSHHQLLGFPNEHLVPDEIGGWYYCEPVEGFFSTAYYWRGLDGDGYYVVLCSKPKGEYSIEYLCRSGEFVVERAKAECLLSLKCKIYDLVQRHCYLAR